VNGKNKQLLMTPVCDMGGFYPQWNWNHHFKLQLDGFEKEVTFTIQRKDKEEIEILAKRKIKIDNLICKNEGVLNKWISVFRESDLQY
jgi:hypothetical protein